MPSDLIRGWTPVFPRETRSVCPEIMLKQEEDEIMIRFNPIGS